MNIQELIGRMEVRRPPVWDLLNGKLIDYDETQRRTTMEWVAEEKHCHSVPGHPRGGVVQGGIITGWIDAAMASVCLFQAAQNATFASLEIKVTFLLPAHPGVYRSHGYVMRIGRSVAFLEGDLYDREDRLIAKASSTAALRPRL